MTETLLLFAGASLLAVGAATLFVAVRTLQTARGYVELAEERLELMREGQNRLLAHMEEQRRIVEEEREEAERDVRTRQGAGRSIERTKQQLLRSRTVERPPAAAPETPNLPERKHPEQPPKPRKAPRPESLPETRSPGAVEGREKSAPPVRAVRHPHPDDDVKPGNTLAGQVRASGGSSIQMFRVFYDRYLDNYEGYVKLAEKIHQAQTAEERVPGSRAQAEWQERLRRVNDGVERTTERLDILEHSNPDLASDDRVSRRAGIARTHSRFAG